MARGFPSGARPYEGVHQMKIIQRGGPTSEEWKAEVSCVYCKTTLEIDAVDVVLVEDQDIEAYNVPCPVCGNDFFVEVPITVCFELARKRERR